MEWIVTTVEINKRRLEAMNMWKEALASFPTAAPNPHHDRDFPSGSFIAESRSHTGRPTDEGWAEVEDMDPSGDELDKLVDKFPAPKEWHEEWAD